MTTLPQAQPTQPANVVPFVIPKIQLRKYVRFTLDGIDRVILSEAPIEHVEMVPRSKLYEVKVVSAGFFALIEHAGQAYVTVSGFSNSLGVSSRPEDSALILQFLKS